MKAYLWLYRDFILNIFKLSSVASYRSQQTRLSIFSLEYHDRSHGLEP
jgi:hypothetical protein